MRGNDNRCGSVIHPTAVVDEGVVLGDGCEVGPFCRFTGRVRVGPDCRFGTGVVIGTEPMDRNFQGEDSGVLIGAGNVFFEYVTVHRATGDGEMTVVGDSNYIMSYVHIAHNCRVGNNCTLTSGVQLGGYTEVGDGANLGGLVGVHQFCRIGSRAMVGAHSYVNRDIPPFMLAAGRPCRVRGVNRVGLQRTGVSDETVAQISAAFRLLYRSGLILNAALKRIEQELDTTCPEIRLLIEFCGSSVRGIELRTGPEEE